MPVWVQVAVGCLGSVLLIVRIVLGFFRSLEKRVDKHELSLYGIDHQNGYVGRMRNVESDLKTVDARIRVAQHATSDQMAAHVAELWLAIRKTDDRASDLAKEAVRVMAASLPKKGTR